VLRRPAHRAADLELEGVEHRQDAEYRNDMKHETSDEVQYVGRSSRRRSMNWRWGRRSSSRRFSGSHPAPARQIALEEMGRRGIRYIFEVEFRSRWSHIVFSRQ
jgi:hypothetical protein